MMYVTQTAKVKHINITNITCTMYLLLPQQIVVEIQFPQILHTHEYKVLLMNQIFWCLHVQEILKTLKNGRD